MLSLLRAAIAFITVLLIGCAGAGPTAPDPSPEAAIIVVPGYYGSRLSQASDHEVVWISLGEALMGRRSLVLPYEELGIHGGLDLQPDGILEGVTVIPYLYTVNAYGSLVKRLRDQFARGALIVPFAYDWRLDLMQTVRALSATVDRLHQQGVSRIIILAHSMGGLVTAYYLRYGVQRPEEGVETWSGASKLSGVILSAVPYRGSMSTFRNMQYGRTVGLNDTLLSPEAVASFPASYYLLPAPQQDLLLSPSRQPYVAQIYQPEDWKENGWGLLRNGQLISKAARDSRMTFTTRWLRRTQQFFDRLNAPSGTTPEPAPPLLSITGHDAPTLAKGLWVQGRGGPFPNVLFDRAHLRETTTFDRAILLDEGDGTVTSTSASLPAAYRSAFQSRELVFALEHRELMSDSHALDAMTTFIESTLNPENE